MKALGRSLVALNYAIQLVWATLAGLVIIYLMPNAPLAVTLAIGALGFPIAYTINRRWSEHHGLDDDVEKRAQHSSPLFGLSVIAGGSALVGYVLLDSLMRGREVSWLTIFLVAQNLWLTWILATHEVNAHHEQDGE